MHYRTTVIGRWVKTVICLLTTAVTLSIPARASAQPAGGSGVIHPSGGTSPLAAKTTALRASAALSAPSDWIYHNGEKLVCADCHTMHFSMSHTWDGTGSVSTTPVAGGNWLGTNGPNSYLLKAADSTALCIACHDGRTGIPDVITADTNGLTERSAGHFDAVDVTNFRGHDLKSGLSSNPTDLCTRCHFGGPHGGAGSTRGVTCIDCHEVHGNGRVRNLRWASWPGHEPAAFGLFMADSALGNINRYEAANVGYGTDNTNNLREVTNMCLDCHHVFSGYYTDTNSNGIHERHPTYDSERNSANSITQGTTRGTTDAAHWQNGTGAGFTNTPRLRFVTNGATDLATSRIIDSSKNGVFCLSCHKAHGSPYGFSLTWNPTGRTTTDGCEQCHNKTSQ